MIEELDRKSTLKTIVGIIVLIVLLISTAYSIYKITITPAEASDAYGNVKGDYVLMLFQCLLGLGLFGVLAVVEHTVFIKLPDFMYILFYIFLFCSVFLGEILNFYYRFGFWDTILHGFSGAMLGALGFIIVESLNRSKRGYVRLSPLFIALFSFCFAIAAGALWETLEFTFDGILKLNMQKYALRDKTLLIGREALSDTMFDIIVDVSSALLVSAVWLTVKFIKRKNQRAMYRLYDAKLR
ncbi:MAG: hypothetical protein PHV32_09690 [Eubacteriales bacterium]|nr:hypothetical protein [Eubacteriales bacterium]